MPGIAGLVTAPPRRIEDPQALLARLNRVQELKHVRFIVRTLESPHCVLSNTLTGILRTTLAQPAQSRSGAASLFLDGEVHNTDELRRELREPCGESPCEVLLSLFLERGPEFVSSLDGTFNIVVYEEKEGRLTVLNDLVSTKALYYKEESGALYFASEKKSILALIEGSPSLDPLGLLQIFAHRHNLSGRTYIQGLQRLLPGHRLEYAGGRLRLSAYRRLRIVVPARLPPERELVDEWCARMRSSTEAKIRGKERILISLSGGLDSRAVTCAVPRDFRPLWARTRGAESSLEHICARQIAERLGIEQYREEPGEVSYSDLLYKVVWRTEGEITFRNGLTMSSQKEMKTHGDFIFGGQFGDAGTGAHIYPYMLVPRSRAAFIERAFRWYQLYPDAMLRRVFSAEMLRSALPALREAFAASFEVHEGEDNIQVYQVWDLLERQARMTMGAGPVDSHLFEKLYPFIGRDNLEFILTLPNRLRFGQCLYQAMIYQLGPEIRDVPNANTGRVLRKSVLANRLAKVELLARKAATRALRRLKLAPPDAFPAARGNMSSATRSDPEFRRAIESFLASEWFDSAVFRREGIQGLLDEHQSGARDHTEILCLVATFAVALPSFLYKRPTACPDEAQPLAGARDRVSVV
jgi:asparagine synthase (glutamine-hydrolysing)